MAALARGFGFKKTPVDDMKTRYASIVEAAITQAGEARERVTVEAPDGTEAYAYPLQGGIAWSVNAAGTGVNILRGVRRPDGSDEAVSIFWRTPLFPAYPKGDGAPLPWLKKGGV